MKAVDVPERYWTPERELRPGGSTKSSRECSRPAPGSSSLGAQQQHQQQRMWAEAVGTQQQQLRQADAPRMRHAAAPVASAGAVWSDDAPVAWSDDGKVAVVDYWPRPAGADSSPAAQPASSSMNGSSINGSSSNGSSIGATDSSSRQAAVATAAAAAASATPNGAGASGAAEGQSVQLEQRLAHLEDQLQHITELLTEVRPPHGRADVCVCSVSLLVLLHLLAADCEGAPAP